MTIKSVGNIIRAIVDRENKDSAIYKLDYFDSTYAARYAPYPALDAQEKARERDLEEFARSTAANFESKVSSKLSSKDNESRINFDMTYLNF